MLDANVYVALGGTPDEFAEMIGKNIERLRPLVQKLEPKMEQRRPHVVKARWSDW